MLARRLIEYLERPSRVLDEPSLGSINLPLWRHWMVGSGQACGKQSKVIVSPMAANLSFGADLNSSLISVICNGVERANEWGGRQTDGEESQSVERLVKCETILLCRPIELCSSRFWSVGSLAATRGSERRRRPNRSAANRHCLCPLLLLPLSSGRRLRINCPCPLA